MKPLTIAYLPIGVGTFHLESAEAIFQESREVLHSFNLPIIAPNHILLTLEDVQTFLQDLDPQYLIIQNVTFANSAYTAQIIRHCNVPVILWSVPEPIIDGGRLRLNSLTGAYSAGNILASLSHFSPLFLYGSPHDSATQHQLRIYLKAIEVKHQLQGMTMATVGHTPQGFGFGQAMESELLRDFGVMLINTEAGNLMELAKSISDDKAKAYLKDHTQMMINMETLVPNNVINFAKLALVYQDYVKTNHIKALASRCWPDFFTNFGTPVCAVLGVLNDLGVAASCEADIYGALSMFIGIQLSGQAVFFGDPVSIDQEENTMTYWHCGTAACSLAHPQTKATMGVHPNRKIGPVMDFGVKPCENVTVFRIGRKPDGKPRFFIMEGKVLDKPKQFQGTSAVVQVLPPILTLTQTTIEAGWEPHFVIIYASVVEELKALAKLLGIEICHYV
ncbi:fucose isomerase [Entomospira nematocerorum]|uniref:Fucose isomerase n=1 Tax=Entomospira nematocerorum TaxID=2719987 RepID=A0A968GCI6_9SPIO|nr:fucose isomerase [Entomospira nematocera]NIZ47279.1 fucose isomerase [Entomospira nematocera]WDI34179.1 fucose isomerase [Entomospira nematocera]